MSGNADVARWVADKLKREDGFDVVKPTDLGYLEIVKNDGISFTAAAIGIKDVVRRNHVSLLFEASGRQPQFVVNVPSKAIWSGDAIEFIHAAPAAFGTFGEMIKASRSEPISAYRNKEYNFFERAFRQHTAVSRVTRVYDRVYRLDRFGGLRDISIVLVDAYDMSAEDIRNARTLYGHFDIAVKTSSYGSITTAASEAAMSMGSEAFTLRELMGRLNRP